MKGLYILLFVLASANAFQAQNIVRSEYFIDTDPGPGNGVTLSLDQDFVTTEIIATNQLSLGLHRMGIRSQSLSGLWSVPGFRFFLIQQNEDGVNTATEIVSAEYFIDADPGPGNAIEVSLDEMNTLNESVSTSGLSLGLHRMGVRTKSTSGFWSVPSFRFFAIQSTDEGGTALIEIETAEYFIDLDPGPGNANEVSLDALNSMNEIVATSSLSLGLHRMGVRTKSTSGLWSVPSFRFFSIQQGDNGVVESDEIVAAEYFTDIDPGQGLGIPISINPSSSVSLDETIEQLGAELGLHSISIRFKSSRGYWSVPSTLEFAICTVYGPLSVYSYQQNGYELNFSSESLNADSLEWVFHDGEISNSLYPTKTYIPGVYPLSLTSFNDCGSNTITDTVALNGVAQLSPLRGANLGTVSMYLYGAGFSESSTFRLIGPEVIEGANVVFNDNNTLAVVQFNLLNHATGEYDVEVGIEGIDLYVHPEPFIVVDTLVGGISYAWNDPMNVRPFNNTTFSLTITNSSNIDINAVPFVMYFPDYATITPQFEISNVPMPGVNDTTTNYFTLLGADAEDFANLKAFLGVCPILPADRSITYAVKVRMNQIGPYTSHGFVLNLNDESPLPINRSFLDAQVVYNTGDRSAGPLGCIAATLGGVADALGLIPGAVGPVVACAAGVGQAAAALACAATGPSDSNSDNLTALGLMTSLAATTANCALAALIVTSPATIAALSLISTLRKATTSINNVTAASTIVSDASGVGDNCFKPKAPPPPCCGASFNSSDPNEIIGVNEGDFFTNEVVLPYSVFFENQATASASAVEVDVYDTLNTELFDMSTFELGAISFGTHNVIVPRSLSQFSTNYGLGDGNIVRIDAELNPLNGVIHWHFITLDSLTLDYPADIFYGFLPPNVNGIEGQAECRYSVARKTSLTHGQVIQNRANIIFDGNPAIITNTWELTLDLIPPVTLAAEVIPTDSASFTLVCEGTDAGVGIGTYTVYISINGGEFIYLEDLGPNGELIVHGNYGDSYAFYSVGADRCGNREAKQPIAELTFTPWPEQIVAIASITGVLCLGDANGSINLNLVGGDGAYAVSWSNGTQGTQLSNLSAGDYTVTVVDGIGNEFQSTYSVESPAVIVANASISAPPCFGQTGSVSLDISGGTAPYDVVWGGQDPSALPVGEYNYSVVDQNHCMFESSFVITAPTALMVESSVVADSNAICEGSITLMVIGGVAPYSFEWSHDATLNSSSAQNLCEGNYTVIVTDANGCEVLNENLLVLTAVGNELLKPSHWVLSPNPTQGQLLLTCGGIEHIDFVDLYNAEGRLIKHACAVQNTIDAAMFMLDLSNYPNGIYTIQINTSTRRETQKVVLSKD
jgi:hypothetical protein